jgi:hypothetical protein
MPEPSRRRAPAASPAWDDAAPGGPVEAVEVITEAFAATPTEAVQNADEHGGQGEALVARD